MMSNNLESPAKIIFILFLGVLFTIFTGYLFSNPESRMNGYAYNTFIATPSVPEPLQQYPMTAASRYIETETRSLQGS